MDIGDDPKPAEIMVVDSLVRDAAHPSRSVLINMSISNATEHLVKLLQDHFLKLDPDDPANIFLIEVGRIGEFNTAGNLDAWESSVLSVFNDTEWDEFEQRYDFGVLESVWELGRFNMYGAINKGKTREFYIQTSKKVEAVTGFVPLEAENFDFSKW